MLFRKRERFERTDVWSYDPKYNYLAIGVLVVVFVAFGILIATLWSKASKPIRLGDSNLTSAVKTQNSASAPAGYSFSGDKFTNVLVLTVDDAAAAKPALQKASILAIDTTAHSATAANLPLDTKVVTGEAPVTLVDLYANQGASACVAPLATAANLRMTHVVVSTDDVWNKIASLKGAGLSAILGSSADLLAQINTDMGIGELLDLAEQVQSIGVSTFKHIDAPVNPEDNGAGGTWSVIDQNNLGAQLGLLVADEPQQQEDEGE